MMKSLYYAFLVLGIILSFYVSVSYGKMYGTYIDKGELLIYPFFEYSYDHNEEYQPEEFGFASKQEYFGKYWSNSLELFVAYGFSDRITLELEAAYLNARFAKASIDNFIPWTRINESGIADIEGQIRARLMHENKRFPEIYGYVELTAPVQKSKKLIGNANWDIKPGVGIIKGFSWGTLGFKTDLEYNRESKGVDIGETAIEYLRKLSDLWRLYIAIEGGEGGAPDEWIFVSGLQWHFSKYLIIKLDNQLGITPKATDWSPQLGIMFDIPAIK
ncbi:MAG: hypothetical protein P8X42_19330 [Calditrichaceae bacterium]